MSAAGSAAATETEAREQELVRMSFLDHLEELRRRLMFSIAALAVAFVLCWAYAGPIFAVLEQPVRQFLPPGEKLAYTRLTAPFFLYMKVAFFGAIFLAAPFILWQLWLFIAPGLYRDERRYAAPFIVFASFFFFLGAWFSYSTVFPMACRFFIETGQNFQQVVTIDDYFSLASKMIIGMGLVFEMPVLIFFFSKLGIITPAFMIQKFKYAVVIIFILAALITPTPDMVTQAALAVPMLLLYLLGIGISYAFGKRHDA